MSVYNCFDNKLVENISNNTKLKHPGDVFIADGVEYIVVMLDSSGKIEVMPKAEYLKNVTVKKYNGEFMTLREIENLKIK